MITNAYKEMNGKRTAGIECNVVWDMGLSGPVFHVCVFCALCSWHVNHDMLLRFVFEAKEEELHGMRFETSTALR